eukprot:CAMPEP_0201695178 /NCGR_PEP_ID=MMETSP0578-20130828/7222_1 /ASSEMBLY_ACC=CAM_ASM_000663 /TAXON_ID=267565 /ORGANISM="Skeletonema grethea, Strain CCMP 1804" /LENGTH=73 /DNA_ID=CAMNT_0048180987 /DNA_START=79 /DNA_END=296 /DNA_ORIENTATION=+
MTLFESTAACDALAEVTLSPSSLFASPSSIFVSSVSSFSTEAGTAGPEEGSANLNMYTPLAALSFPPPPEALL